MTETKKETDYVMAIFLPLAACALVWSLFRIESEKEYHVVHMKLSSEIVREETAGRGTRDNFYFKASSDTVPKETLIPSYMCYKCKVNDSVAVVLEYQPPSNGGNSTVKKVVSLK